MQLQREEGMVRNKLPELVQKQSTYMDVHISCYADEIAIVSPITVPLGRTERHVEITGIEKEPYGLSGLLNVTKSLSVTNDTSILDFSECSGFQDLEECELGWCHKMKSVFYQYVDIKNLRNLHVCHLKRLVMFCAQYALMAFSSLVHLHLEDCPRLEHVLSDAVRLPCLKTLDILLCYNLKGIFVDGDMQYNSYQLPRLERVRLHELPLLQYFQEKDATITAQMWKELHIRGCWSLRRLPRLHDQRETVKVNGEWRWWNKLKWGSPLHRNNYEPKLPPKFSSFIEHAEVTSYLR
uniref:Uncharacterized protein n=1 Tax=Avena sativa TaxID=4498 RepID=A0ACD5TZ42_AVESA